MNKTPCPFRFLGGILLALALVAGSSSRAATLIWTNTAGGDWNAATNWSPNQVPGGSDSAWITNGGTYTVELQNYYGNAISNLVVGGASGTQTFTMSFLMTNNGLITINPNGVMLDYFAIYDGDEAYGTLAGPGALTSSGQFTWNGSLNLPQITNSGVASLEAGQMNGCEFVNSGQLTLTSYYYFNGGSSLSNTPTGRITSTIIPNFDPYWTPAFEGSGGSVVNAGLLILSYPGDSDSSSPPYNVAPWVGYASIPMINIGTLVITNASYFSLNGGGTNYGNIIIDAGSTLICSNNYQFGPGTVTGGGALLNECAGLNLSGTIACGFFGDDQNKTTIVTGALNATNSMFDASTIFTNNGSLQGSILIRFGSMTCMGTGLLQPSAINLQGSIYGTNPVVATGPLTWTGVTGNIFDSVSVNGGTINAPSSTSIGSGGVLINTGTMSWTPNSGPRTGGGAIISNAPSGVINAVCNGNSFDNYVYGGGMSYFNAGQINLSGTNQTGVFTCPFINSGTVNVNSNTLSLADGGTNSGTINVATNGNLNFSGGSYNCTGSSLLAGAGNLFDSGNGTYNLAGEINLTGTWAFGGGTLNLLGSSTAADNTLNISGSTVNFNGPGPWLMGTLNLSAGTLAGSTLVTVLGQLTWTGGNIEGLLSADGGSINVTAGSAVFEGGELINMGNLNWTPNSGPRTGQGTIISNAPSGVINAVLNGNSLDNYVYGGAAAFYNAGTINVSGTGQGGSITDPFINTGTVNINSGTLSLGGGGTNFSTINVPSGADLDFSGGTFTSTAGSLITGAGNLSTSNYGVYNFAGPLNLGGTWSFPASATVNLTGSTTSGNTINLSAATVNFNGTGDGGAWRPGTLNLSGGTLAGSTPVMASGQLTWTGGNIEGLLSADGGSINVTAGSAVYDGGELINTGNLNWTPNSGPHTGLGTVISNAPSGVISVALNGNSIDSYAYGGTTAFYNAGTINVSGAGQSGWITDPFFNTGTVNVNSGTLTLIDGGTENGQFTTAASATLQLAGGTFNFSNGTILNGVGTNNFNSGTVNFSGTGSVSGSSWLVSGASVNLNGSGNISPVILLLNSGTLAGSYPLQVAGPLIWTGGNIGGILSANGGSINVAVGSSLNGGELINTGNLTWTPNSGPRTGNGTVISNSPSGVIGVALNGNDIDSYAYGGATAFYNAGVINVSGAGQSGFITDPFFNTGTLNVNSGTLSLTGSGTNASGMVVAVGATLAVAGGTYNFSSGSALTGGGTNNFSSGTVNFLGNGTLSGISWLMSGANVNLNGSGSLAPTSLVLSSGMLAGSYPLQVAGPLVWTGGNIAGSISANGGSINVAAGSTLNGGGELINTGNLTWTPNSGPRTGNGTVISNSPSGVISVALNGNDIDSYAYGGATAFYNAGVINVSGAGQSGFITDPFFNSGTVNLNSGTLNLTGGTSLTNGTLNFGIASASNYGKLAISGSVALKGALNAIFNGYTPVAGNAFGLISYGSESGAFSAFNLPGMVNWQKTYGSTLFTLMVTSLIGAPDMVVARSGNSLMFSWPTNGSYTLQQNTNLAASNGWTTSGYTPTTANGTNSITIIPQAGNLFFRLSSP